MFVEKGGSISPKEFAKLLAEGMPQGIKRIPKDLPDEGTMLRINSQRVLYEFIGDVWHSDGYDWTILYDEECQLADPTYSRTVTVRAIDDVNDVLPLLNDGIQTIGLALHGAKRLDFAESATLNGVERCPDVGFMTSFESPWDGIIVMDRMVRWATLGGP